MVDFLRSWRCLASSNPPRPHWCFRSIPIIFRFDDYFHFKKNRERKTGLSQMQRKGIRNPELFLGRTGFAGPS